MRRLGASGCRRAGTASACRCAGSRSRGRWWSRFGSAAHAGAADPGQDRGDDVVAQGQQGGDGAGGVWRDVVAAGPAGFGDELLAAEFTQVVGGLPGGVAVVPGEVADLGGVLGDGESARGRGQGECGGQGGPDPRLVQVDPGDPAWVGTGSSSSTPSGRKPMSAQSSAVANRSAMPASRSMIWPKYSRLRLLRCGLCRVCSPCITISHDRERKPRHLTRRHLLWENSGEAN
jgi:hypothetical protein